MQQINEKISNLIDDFKKMSLRDKKEIFLILTETLNKEEVIAAKDEFERRRLDILSKNLNGDFTVKKVLAAFEAHGIPSTDWISNSNADSENDVVYSINRLKNNLIRNLRISQITVKKRKNDVEYNPGQVTVKIVLNRFSGNGLPQLCEQIQRQVCEKTLSNIEIEDKFNHRIMTSILSDTDEDGLVINIKSIDKIHDVLSRLENTIANLEKIKLDSAETIKKILETRDNLRKEHQKFLEMKDSFDLLVNQASLMITKKLKIIADEMNKNSF